MKLNFSILIAVVVAAVSYGLYQLSYEVQGLEKDLKRLNANISANQEAIRVLKAEWAFVNRPDKLQELATKHLPLLLVAPYQVAQLDELPARTANPFVREITSIPVPRKKPRARRGPASPPVSGPVHMATFKKQTKERIVK